jgi:hypothetical protein
MLSTRLTGLSALTSYPVSDTQLVELHPIKGKKVRPQPLFHRSPHVHPLKACEAIPRNSKILINAALATPTYGG